MDIVTTRDLKNVIRNAEGRTEEIRQIVHDSVSRNPLSMFIVPSIIRYLTAEMQRSLATQVIA